MSVEISLLRVSAARRVTAVRFTVAVLFGVNSAVECMLMLAVMSFNGRVFIDVVVGLAAGYFVFQSENEEGFATVENPCACA